LFDFLTEEEFLFRHVKSGNQDLAIALTDWLFKQRGVLRARNIHHYLVEDKTTPRFYTIKNDIVRK
jgi:oligosaccharyltransferase complex subunit beta